MGIETPKYHSKPFWKISKSDVFVIFLLVFFLSLSYGQTAFFDFVAFDDDHYVYENEKILIGVTWDSIRWAFSFTDQTYWHPLTWMSLLLDSEIFGLNPGAFHLVNVIWHFFDSILVYFFFFILTDRRKPSALIAILFAIHPINVESVAWITERKNVLSTFFILSSLISYCHYIERPTAHRFLTTFFLFFFGLLAKPITVITPFLFLLVDMWFLQKNRPISTNFNIVFSKKILDKTPYFFLGLLVVFIASKSLEQQSMVIDFIKIPVSLRISNAGTSIISYLSTIFFPAGLGVYYPFPETVPLWKSAGSFFLLAALSLLFLKQARIRPYFLFGWLWFLGSLAPVLGIKIAGLWPAYADRWAYIPAIGIFFIFSCLFFELYDGLEKHKRFFGGLCLFGIIFCCP